MTEVIADKHWIMCSIRPELGCQVCIDEHAANLVHDGEAESHDNLGTPDSQGERRDRDQVRQSTWNYPMLPRSN